MQMMLDVDRLGDEIAELSAHLEAATARLLDRIREFDAREGWNTGFRSCAAWLSWRVGLDPGAALPPVPDLAPVPRDVVEALLDMNFANGASIDADTIRR